MAKQGMKRPEITELQGKAKHTKTPAAPIIAGTASPALKVYHGVPHSTKPFPNEYVATDAVLDGDNDILP